MSEEQFRVESDLLGELKVPAEAYYGVQTQRAINNYHISRKKMYDYPDYIIAIAYVKLAWALSTTKLQAPCLSHAAKSSTGRCIRTSR